MKVKISSFFVDMIYNVCVFIHIFSRLIILFIQYFCKRGNRYCYHCVSIDSFFCFMYYECAVNNGYFAEKRIKQVRGQK